MGLFRNTFSDKRVIRLDYAPLWFFCGLLFEYLNQKMAQLHLEICLQMVYDKENLKLKGGNYETYNESAGFQCGRTGSAPESGQ